MKRTWIFAFVVIIFTSSISFAANVPDIPVWKALGISKTTLDTVISLFGPPGLIRTEERYSDWAANMVRGCGQMQSYGMVYSIATGDLNILHGPLGMATEVTVIIDNGTVNEVEWKYENNQMKPALGQWTSRKNIKRIVPRKPYVLMMSLWNPTRDTQMFVTCYTGGEGAVCQGPITVDYMEASAQPRATKNK
jgi:hypothetical protein